MTIPSLVLNPLQFCDQNGKPYSGGIIFTRIMGTYTPKTTWKDPWQSAVNENPLTLDAAGRCEIWADGDYQIQLNDAAGNMIFNVPATTVISAAMYPVVSAPSIPDAVAALGIDDLIAAEATARVNADNAEAATRETVDADLHTLIDAEVTDRTNADNTEKNERVTEDLTLQAQINTLSSGSTGFHVQGAAAILGASGYVHVTFPTTFPTACDGVVATISDISYPSSGVGPVTFLITNVTTSGADVAAYNAAGGLTVPLTFWWVATGY